jgi:hypothetical protein
VNIIHFDTNHLEDEVERQSMNMKLQRYSFYAPELWATLRFVAASLFVSILTLSAMVEDVACIGRRRMGERSATHIFRMLKLKIDGLRGAYPSYACVALLSFLLFDGFSSRALAKTTVPFVGCVGVNMEDTTPPTGDPFPVDLSENDAKQLSLYVGANIAALGPRGWNCDESDGPAVAELQIYPYGGSVNSGPAIIFMVRSAETPNNDREIASYGRQYFSKIVPRSKIPVPIKGYIDPYQVFFVPFYNHDAITYLDDRTLVFSTPKGQNGLGASLFYNDGYNGAGNYFKLPVTGLMGLLAGQGNPSYLIYFLALRKPDVNDRESQLIINFARKCIARNMNPVCNLQKILFGLSN